MIVIHNCVSCASELIGIHSSDVTYHVDLHHTYVNNTTTNKNEVESRICVFRHILVAEYFSNTYVQRRDVYMSCMHSSFISQQSYAAMSCYYENQITQELICCWDGRAMLHKLTFLLSSGVPLFNALFLWEYHHYYIAKLKTRFFGLHLCRREHGTNFNHFDVIGSKATEFGQITQNIDHYAVQDALSVPIDTPYTRL